MSGSTVRDLTQEELMQMQMLQLYIMVEIDRICRKNGIQYTLCGGSLLGAARNGGFIPWDDDIDIAMLRTDYNRFFSVCNTELDHGIFSVQTMESDPGYRQIWGRVLLNNTEFVRYQHEHLDMKTGIFVDIFPRDSCSNLFPVRLVQSVAGYFIRKALYSPTGAIAASSAVSRYTFRMFSCIPRSVLLHLSHFINRIGGKNSEIVCCYGLMSNIEHQIIDGQNVRRKNLSIKKSSEKMLRKVPPKRVRTELGYHDLIPDCNLTLEKTKLKDAFQEILKEALESVENWSEEDFKRHRARQIIVTMTKRFQRAMGYNTIYLWPKIDRVVRKEIERGIRRKWFDDVMDVSFEGFSFMATKFYDEWLTYAYGDWRLLPPAEKRVMHQLISSIRLRDIMELPGGPAVYERAMADRSRSTRRGL